MHRDNKKEKKTKAMVIEHDLLMKKFRDALSVVTTILKYKTDISKDAIKSMSLDSILIFLYLLNMPPESFFYVVVDKNSTNLLSGMDEINPVYLNEGSTIFRIYVKDAQIEVMDIPKVDEEDIIPKKIVFSKN